LSEIFTVIDVESTGLNHATDHITEIAAIRVEMSPLGRFREIGRFQTYVALPDGVKIPSMITKLTGIRQYDLYGAPSEAYALTTLEDFVRGTTVIAHNAPFDLAFVHYVFEPHSFICTRALSRLVEPEESASLKDVCARHDIELSGHHRAMNDAEATVRVLAKLRRIAEARGIEYRNVVIDSEERPLTFVPAGAIVRKITKEAV
jgi:DNA polymerase-3 subunit epsilon